MLKLNSQMKILITGVAGFVGSHLAKLLAKRKDELFGICLGCEDLESLSSIRKKITIYKCDITDFPKLLKIVKKIKPDQVYHLAAASSAGRSFREPLVTFDVNIYGTICLLEAIRHAKPDARILIVGSGDVYGMVKKTDIPIKESLSLNPVSPYGASKAACDILGYQYFKAYNMKTIRTRSFNHAGPGQSLGFAIPDFCSQIAKIELGMTAPRMKVGNLGAVRDLTDVRDVVHAYKLLMRYGEIGEAYNVCSGRRYTIKEVLYRLLALSRKKIRILPDKGKRRATDIPILIGDNSKIRKEVKWRPEIPLDKTLRDSLDYWRKKQQIKMRTVHDS